MKAGNIVSGAKDNIKSKWPVILIVSLVIFASFVLYGLFAPKKQTESAKQLTSKKTDIKKIYLKSMRKVNGSSLEE